MRFIPDSERLPNSLVQSIRRDRLVTTIDEPRWRHFIDCPKLAILHMILNNQLQLFYWRDYIVSEAPRLRSGFHAYIL